jgi:hypothetical protein
MGRRADYSCLDLGEREIDVVLSRDLRTLVRSGTVQRHTDLSGCGQ